MTLLFWLGNVDMNSLSLPAFLKNIALAHESNKNYSEAILYLKKYRAFAPFEEQEELRAWLTEFELPIWHNNWQPKKNEEEVEAVMAAENTPENITPVEEKSDVESVTVEIQPVAAPKRLHCLERGGYRYLVAAASLSTIQTHRLYTDINTYCDLIDGSGYCSSEVEENDLLNQFKRSQTTSLHFECLYCWNGTDHLASHQTSPSADYP